MKRTLICIAAILLCIVAAAFSVLHYFNNGYLAERIGGEILKATGSPVVFKQNPTLSLSPLAVKFGETSWKSPGREPFVRFTAQGGAVEPELLPLIMGKIALKDITLEKPTVEINIPASPAPGTKKNQSSAAAFLPEVGRIMAQGGNVVWNDGNYSLRLDGINFSAENLGKRQEADIKCDFTLNLGEREREIKEGAPPVPLLAGNLAFNGKMRFYEPNLTFRQASATFTATEGNAAKELSPLHLSFDGAINLDTSHVQLQMASLALPQGSLEVKGEGNLLESTFEGRGAIDANMTRLARYLDLKPTVGAGRQNDMLIFAGPVRVDGSVVTLRDLAIRVGSGTGVGEIKIKMPVDAEPLAIDGHLTLGKIAINDYILDDSGKRNAEKADTKDGGWTPDMFPALNVRLDVAGLAYKKLRISNLGCLLHGQEGAYRLDDFTLQVAKGGVLASAQADFSTHDLSVQANGRDVDLGAALDIFGIGGLEAGRTAFEANLHAKGSSLSSLKETLSGNGQMESRGLKIAALNSITDLLRLFGDRNVDLGTSFTVIKTLFLAENGNVRFSPITASSRAVSLEGVALVDLTKAYLDGSASIRALGLDLPITFGGPFEDIRFGVSPEAIMNANRNLPKELWEGLKLNGKADNTSRPEKKQN